MEALALKAPPLTFKQAIWVIMVVVYSIFLICGLLPRTFPLKIQPFDYQKWNLKVESYCEAQKLETLYRYSLPVDRSGYSLAVGCSAT